MLFFVLGKLVVRFSLPPISRASPFGYDIETIKAEKYQDMKNRLWNFSYWRYFFINAESVIMKNIYVIFINTCNFSYMYRTVPKPTLSIPGFLKHFGSILQRFHCYSGGRARRYPEGGSLRWNQFPG